MDDNPELIISGDGSHTLFSSVFDTHYHSKHGAVTESQVVYIQAALDYLIGNTSSIDVFEMGFGTGLNALLAYQWADIHKIKIKYCTVEAHPVPDDVVKSLNYGVLLNEVDVFNRFHKLSWNTKHHMLPFFSFTKWHDKLESLVLNEQFDVVFYDAFGPSDQPELWQEPILNKIFEWLRPAGILTSFCAQGAFRRALKQVGFSVEKLQGPPGKREMTRAIKTSIYP